MNRRTDGIARLTLRALALVVATTSGPAAADGEQPPVFALPPLDSFTAIVERPLFSPSRRQIDDSVEGDNPGDVVAETPPAALVLVGLTSGAEGRAVAVLRNSADASEFQVWIGDTIGGWQVSAIQPRALHLSAAGEEIEVTLVEPEVPEAPGPR